MSENGRKRRDEGPGWFATLGGAAILVVLGFGVGLVAGAAWEEPDLVMDHFAGRTTEVPLAGTAGAPGAPLQEVAGTPPAQPAARPPLGTPAGAPAVRPAAVSAPAPRGGHAIQVGAFGDATAAEGLVSQLRGAGFPVYVIEDTGGSARFKVRVGPVAEREEAEALAARLKERHRLPTWILSRDAR